MKVILVARKALAAYLISSAVRRLDVKYRRGVQIKRPVQFGQHRARPRVVGADHDAVRMLEVLDGGALAQEFRIGDDLHLRVGTLLAQDALDLVAGADRHGRLGDHDRGARQQRGDLAHRLEHEAQIGVTVAAPRRGPDRDHHRIGLGDADRLAGEGEPALADIGFHKLGEAGLEDRDLAAIKRRDARRILVDAGDVMTKIGKAGPGNQTRHNPRRSWLRA